MTWQGLQGDNLTRLSNLAIRLLEKSAQEALEGATIQLGPEFHKELQTLKLRKVLAQPLIPQKLRNLESFKAVRVNVNEDAPF